MAFVLLVFVHSLVEAGSVGEVLGVLVLVDEIQHKSRTIGIAVLLHGNVVVLELVVNLPGSLGEHFVDELQHELRDPFRETVVIRDGFELVIEVNRAVMVVVKQDDVLVSVSVLIDKVGEISEILRVCQPNEFVVILTEINDLMSHHSFTTRRAARVVVRSGSFAFFVIVLFFIFISSLFFSLQKPFRACLSCSSSFCHLFFKYFPIRPHVVYVNLFFLWSWATFD